MKKLFDLKKNGIIINDILDKLAEEYNIEHE
jgi:hypothetical protein